MLQVVYVGDGNNIVHSWIRLAAKFNFEFVCACPKGFEPDAATVELANAAGAGKVSISYDPMEVSLHTSLRHSNPYAKLLQILTVPHPPPPYTTPYACCC